MDDAPIRPTMPKPFFTGAAWFSLIGPLLAAVLVFYFGRLPPIPPDGPVAKQERKHHSKVVLGSLAVVSAFGLVAGITSLWGVRRNGALTILPPALLGILISALLEVFALFLFVLTDLPGP